jgi:hypothetical protein
VEECEVNNRGEDSSEVDDWMGEIELVFEEFEIVGGD